MKKLKVFAAFGLLVFLMSSCVYSLFPIYTEDTLVYLPELVGKWMSDPENEENYIEFIPMSEPDPDDNISLNEDRDGDIQSYTYMMQGEGWSIKSDDPITVEINGKEVSDPKEVKAYYDQMFAGMRMDAKDKLDELITPDMARKVDSTVSSSTNGLGKALNDLSGGLGKLGKALKETEAKFKGSAYVTRDESYKMIVMENNERYVYQAHIAQIGEDLFLDLYPLPEFSDAAFGANLFPVHTFMKLRLNNGNLELTQFDLEKLNKLFESNLIRLRHEMVDGVALISAQPEEIQKFLDRYSNDDSVFENKEVYTKLEE